MYQVIKKHPPDVDQYAKKLVGEKVVSEEEYKVLSQCGQITYLCRLVSIQLATHN